MIDQDAADARARTHRALGHARRVQIMRLLEVEPGDVRSLVEATGLHHNTVRAHLAVLESGGLIERTKVRSGSPGRPSWRYAPAPRSADGTEGRFEALATSVIDAVLQLSESTEDAARAAEVAGMPWGRDAVHGERRTDLAGTVDRIDELLDDMGFAPALQTDAAEPRWLLRSCPFADLARRHEEVVCSIHLGVLRGALAELVAPVTAELHPFVEHDRCAVVLGVGG